MLIAAKGDINFADGLGRSPLHVAARALRPKQDVMVKRLLEAKASASAKDQFGMCALDYAQETVPAGLSEGPKIKDAKRRSTMLLMAEEVKEFRKAREENSAGFLGELLATAFGCGCVRPVEVQGEVAAQTGYVHLTDLAIDLLTEWNDEDLEQITTVS